MVNLAIDLWITSPWKMNRGWCYCQRCDVNLDRNLFCVQEVTINLALKGLVFTEEIEEIIVICVMLT